MLDYMKQFMKRIVCLIIAFAMVITLFPATQLIVKAADITPNAKGDSNISSNGTCHGGASYTRQGYRVYIIDQDTKEILSNFKCKGADGKETYAQVRDLYAFACEKTTGVGTTLRMGKGKIAASRMRLVPGMPAAFTSTGTGQGVKLAKWMMENRWRMVKVRDEKTGKVELERKQIKNSRYLCSYALGGYDGYKLVAKESPYNYAIVVEPIIYHAIFKSYTKGSITKTSYFGTGNNWLRKYDAMGLNKTYTSSYDSVLIQRALTLQRKQLGLTKPTSKITKSNPLTLDRRGQQGFSIHFYSFKPTTIKSDKTHTFDYQYNNSKFRPEKAPKEEKSEGITIVKTYRVKKINKDGDVKYIDKGTYVRKETLKKIKIENEPTSKVQYHVIGYQTTDKVKKDIDALKWKSIMEDKEQVGNATKSATVKPNNNAVVTTVTLHKKVEKQKNKKTGKTETVKQKHDETVLYVLLQKEEKEKPISGDYTLKQSQISKRVDLYKTEKDKNILKGHSFVWDSSALNDACSGHTYYHSSENCTGHTYYCSWSLDDTSLSLAIMNARYRADEYKYNIAYKAWDDEWEDTEVANQC